jgi:hypothetical protein
MDSFQTRLKVKSIRADLLALPKGLDAYDTAYDDAMTRIFGQERDYQESAEKILSLILCAQRPLASRELQHALMIETGDTELDLDNSLDSETMLSVCAGLITIDESSDTIRFVHYTTQEYLQRTQKRWLPKAELKIARACLDYLLLHEFSLAPEGTSDDADSVSSDTSSADLSDSSDESTNRDDAYGFVGGKRPDDFTKDIEFRGLVFPFAGYASIHGSYHWDAVVKTESSMHADLLSLLVSSWVLDATRQFLSMYSSKYKHGYFQSPGSKPGTVVQWLSEAGLAHLTEFCIVNGFAYNTKGTSI